MHKKKFLRTSISTKRALVWFFCGLVMMSKAFLHSSWREADYQDKSSYQARWRAFIGSDGSTWDRFDPAQRKMCVIRFVKSLDTDPVMGALWARIQTEARAWGENSSASLYLQDRLLIAMDVMDWKPGIQVYRPAAIDRALADNWEYVSSTVRSVFKSIVLSVDTETKPGWYSPYLAEDVKRYKSKREGGGVSR